MDSESWEGFRGRNLPGGWKSCVVEELESRQAGRREARRERQLLPQSVSENILRPSPPVMMGETDPLSLSGHHQKFRNQ